ncbi:hypothetical protein SAMN04487948_11760 [Halogranum amylolyticum]|uniref:Uncharacterized protein n=1 Tax=Halogranum amylolyticum TaxID=660520 RepID=A0A1H8VK62_9EURY|nr:hypothetical protein SAMN04487948_11760 [Halogranum amylolyticum]
MSRSRWRSRKPRQATSSIGPRDESSIGLSPPQYSNHYSLVPPFRVGHVVFREPLAYHLNGYFRCMPSLIGTIVEREIQNPSWWEDRTEVCADAGDVLPDADGNLVRDTDVESPLCGARFSRPRYRVLKTELCSGSVICPGAVRTLKDVDSIGASTPVGQRLSLRRSAVPVSGRCRRAPRDTIGRRAFHHSRDLRRHSPARLR